MKLIITIDIIHGTGLETAHTSLLSMFPGNNGYHNVVAIILLLGLLLAKKYVEMYLLNYQQSQYS